MIETITDRKEIGTWLTEHGLTGIGVEIGVQNGINAEQILKKWNGYLWLVDPWKKQPAELYRDGTNDIDFEAALATAQKRLEPFPARALFLRLNSDEAANFFRATGITFDFIYIDGNHSMPQVERDLENYWPMCREGGLFGGHDYLTLDAPEWRCDVEETVNRFVQKRGLKLHVTNEEGGWPSWWIQK